MVMDIGTSFTVEALTAFQGAVTVVSS